VFTTILLAFAFSFHLAMRKHHVFDNAFTSFLKMINMMAGEYNFDENFTFESGQSFVLSSANFLPIEFALTFFQSPFLQQDIKLFVFLFQQRKKLSIYLIILFQFLIEESS
jgi:hypothetical protein